MGFSIVNIFIFVGSGINDGGMYIYVIVDGVVYFFVVFNVFVIFEEGI